MTLSKKAGLVLGARRRREPAWKAVLRIADKHAPAMRRGIERVVADRQADLDVAALERAIADGDRAEATRIALAALPSDTFEVFGADVPIRVVASETELTERVLDIMEDSANATRCATREPHWIAGIGGTSVEEFGAALSRKIITRRGAFWMVPSEAEAALTRIRRMPGGAGARIVPVSETARTVAGGKGLQVIALPDGARFGPRGWV